MLRFSLGGKTALVALGCSGNNCHWFCPFAKETAQMMTDHDALSAAVMAIEDDPSLVPKFKAILQKEGYSTKIVRTMVFVVTPLGIAAAATMMEVYLTDNTPPRPNHADSGPGTHTGDRDVRQPHVADAPSVFAAA